MLTILLVLLIVIALGGGGYGLRTGWAAGTPLYGGLGLVIILILIVMLFGGLPVRSY